VSFIFLVIIIYEIKTYYFATFHNVILLYFGTFIYKCIVCSVKICILCVHNSSQIVTYMFYAKIQVLIKNSSTNIQIFSLLFPLALTLSFVTVRDLGPIL